MKKLARNIYYYRTKAGLTQTELGVKCGVTTRMVGFWEQGLKNVTAEKLELLCKALGVTPNELMGIG